MIRFARRPPVWTAVCLLALSLALGGVANASTPSTTGSADEVVVIRSNAESYPVGKTLSLSRDKVTLTAAQKVMLVDSLGGLRRLSGPFSGPIAEKQAEGSGQSSVAVVTVLASLLSDPNRKSDWLRSGGGGPAELPTPWAVSVEHSGAACAQSDRVTLWRRDGARDSRLVIDMGAGGKKARVTWAQGSGILPMPASLFTSGQTYLVKVDDQEVSLVLHIAPAAATSPVETAVWMANVGCKAQALAMIDSIQ